MFARKNQIYIGSLNNPLYYFDNSQIHTCSAAQTVSLVGQELSIDVFNPVVSDNESNLTDVYHFRSSDHQEIKTGIGQIFAVNTDKSGTESDLINLEYGTPVWYYHEDELVGKFYIETVKRQATNKFQLNCVSAIGLLSRKMHGGGLFTGTTFGAVLSHILADGLHGTGNPVIEYEIDDDVASLPVSGWLPYASKRDNLYQLIFSNGVNIVKNYDGKPRFTFVYSGSDNPRSISIENIYDGGSIEYTKPYSEISVAEHIYTQPADLSGAEPEVVFDNSSSEEALSHDEIWFENAPVIVSTLDIQSGDLVIESVTENSAVLSGQGVLVGVPYIHSTRTIKKSNSQSTEEKTVSVSDCTMVNAVNSSNLLNRLFAFYCPTGYIKKITNSIIYSNEKCGKSYQIVNPYGQTETAFLSSMDMKASSINKADCEFYANYDPAGQSGLYKNVIIFTENGSWTVPNGVHTFKAVLIGGGTGGSSGWPGENGQDASANIGVGYNEDLSSIWYGAEGGEGGEGGSGGAPGKVKVVVIEDDGVYHEIAGETFNFTIGSGGAGGSSTGFIPDTLSELRAALENEDPDTEYTDSEIEDLIATENTDWDGSPNSGYAGTPTSITRLYNEEVFSTADNDAFTPAGGIYDPINDEYYALTGKAGVRGGKGGARQVEENGAFNWVTDGEDVTDEDGKVYHGGITGEPLTSVSGLSEANIIAYGGNGAGAAVGIDRDDYPMINGQSDQETNWSVSEDE